jgi:cobalt-zinc-cadmium efflux system outer membrane protein
MRWLTVLVLALPAGCQACRSTADCALEAQVAAVAPLAPIPAPPPCLAPSPPSLEAVDLRSLWNLALAYNPALRESAAGLAVARGRQIQAGKYLNPTLTYEEEDLGTSHGPAGTIRIQLSQELITGGKRRLDIAIATRGTNAAFVALLGQKFDVLTRIRRGFTEYVAWHQTVGVNEEVVKVLEKGRDITRQLVETAKTRPRSDLLRVEALLEEARINLQNSRINRQAAWRQLAADVGLPDLPLPAGIGAYPDLPYAWDADTVTRRVLSVHADIKRAALEVERNRLMLERARAEVVPNVTLGGGFSRNFSENDAGAIVSLQTRLPVWDRRQGEIQSAQASLAQAQMALLGAATRLSRDTAEAFGRYQGARYQLDRLTREVLPRVRESLKLIQDGYAKAAAQYTFADVLSAQQSLNDTEIRVAQTRRDLWRAIADLQGLMQLDLGEDLQPCR